MNAIVPYDELPVHLPRVVRMMRIAANTTRKNRTTRKISKHARGHRDVSRAKTCTGHHRIRVIADTKRILSEVREDIFVERNMLGCGHLDRSRHLLPLVPHALKLRATEVTRLQRVFRIRDRVPSQERPALLTRVALFA